MGIAVVAQRLATFSPIGTDTGASQTSYALNRQNTLGLHKGRMRPRLARQEIEGKDQEPEPVDEQRTQCGAAERVVANPQVQTAGTLPLLWRQWQHEGTESLLWPEHLSGLQVGQ